MQTDFGRGGCFEYRKDYIQLRRARKFYIMQKFIFIYMKPLLKYGLIGGIIGLISGVIPFIFSFFSHCWGLYNCPPDRACGNPTFCTQIIFTRMDIFILIGVLIGIIIGLVVGKIKAKRQV